MAHSEATARAIIDQIAAGHSIELAAANNGVDDSTVYRWANGQGAPYDGFREDYARAMVIKSDRMAEEIIKIADDSAPDFVGLDDKGKPIIDGDAIRRAELRISTRKWLMSHHAPKKYGNSTTLKGDQDAPLEARVRIVDDA